MHSDWLKLIMQNPIKVLYFQTEVLFYTEFQYEIETPLKNSGSLINYVGMTVCVLLCPN